MLAPVALAMFSESESLPGGKVVIRKNLRMRWKFFLITIQN